MVVSPSAQRVDRVQNSPLTIFFFLSLYYSYPGYQTPKRYTQLRRAKIGGTAVPFFANHCIFDCPKGYTQLRRAKIGGTVVPFFRQPLHFWLTRHHCILTDKRHQCISASGGRVLTRRKTQYQPLYPICVSLFFFFSFCTYVWTG